MPINKIFLDTSYIQATLDSRDQYYNLARKFIPLVGVANLIWTTEAILSEVGDALSKTRQNRILFSNFIGNNARDNRVIVANVSSELFNKALTLYRNRSDKTWGLTDCISFVVMQQEGITDALTTDHHFVQAGFRALLLEDI